MKPLEGPIDYNYDLLYAYELAERMGYPNVEGPGGFLDRMTAVQFSRWVAYRNTMVELQKENRG